MDRRLTWDERYARGGPPDFTPSPLLAEAIHGVAAGRALDLACGTGRHALLLAERGWEVVAVDGSAVGLGLLEAEAARRGLTVRAVVAELEGETPGFVPEPDGYELVCDFFFLARERFPALRAAVRPGGRFVAAIHVAADHRFLLRPGELAALVAGWGWDILLAREGTTAEIVARRPA
jgi:tellurite methyltransferase